MKLRRLTASLALTLTALACTTPGPSADSFANAINYRSTSGQEYSLSAQVRFQLSAEDQSAPLEERDARIEKAARTRIDAVTKAVNAELNRIWPEDDRTDGDGIAILLRQSTPSLASLREADDGGTYAFDYALEFGAQTGLDQRLPTRTEDGQKYFVVKAAFPDGEQEVPLTIRAVERSRNAYPLYDQLFEGGLDIAIHVGGDYNDSRDDLSHARQLFTELGKMGFTAPVPKFEDLKLDSAPFKRTLKVKGQSVEVRVRLYHAELTKAEEHNKLIDAFKGSVKTADIILYSGHAGTSLDYSGVQLAYKPSRVSIPADEFKNLDAPDKYQIYIFDGCETYTGYADRLYANPKKNATNADVVTVVNYSATQAAPNQAYAFLRSFLAEQDGQWVPRSWDSVLEKVNTAAEKSWVHVYGVHGLDDNPKLSPLANVSKFGATCQVDADCGALDSYCLTIGENVKKCGLGCADAAGCPNGARCSGLQGYPSSDYRQCIPSP